MKFYWLNEILHKNNTLKKQNVGIYENLKPQETKCSQKEWRKLASAWFVWIFKQQKSINKK